MFILRFVSLWLSYPQHSLWRKDRYLYNYRIWFPLFQCFIIPRDRLNTKISSYRYRDSHYKDKTVWLPSHLYNAKPHTWKGRLYVRRGPGSFDTMWLMKNIICPIDRLISQISVYTCFIAHNAPFRTEICIFLFWMGHFGIWNRCSLGYMS